MSEMYDSIYLRLLENQPDVTIYKGERPLGLFFPDKEVCHERRRVRRDDPCCPAARPGSSPLSAVVKSPIRSRSRRNTGWICIPARTEQAPETRDDWGREGFRDPL